MHNIVIRVKAYVLYCLEPKGERGELTLKNREFRENNSLGIFKNRLFSLKIRENSVKCQHMEKLESIIATNLIYLRRRAKLTQLEFGEKFNYSDKTVSKWEMGTVIPSVETLKQIADFYGVSLDYICTQHKSSKDYESEKGKVVKPQEKMIFMALFVTILWFIAAAVYAIGYMRFGSGNNWWISFVYAVPLSFFVLAYFVMRYFKGSKWSYIFFSAFIWTVLAAVFFNILLLGENYWFLFIIGAPAQASIILLRKLRKNN